MDTRTMRLTIGVVCLVAGGVLLLWFRDERFLIFQGQALGVVLAIVGIIDLMDVGRGKFDS